MVRAGEVIRAADVAVQACRVSRATTQTITDATETTVAFTTEDFDTDTMHDTVTNNTRITINTAGIYAVSFGCEFSGSTAYARIYAKVNLNATTVIAFEQLAGIGSGSPLAQRLCMSTLYQFDVADYIEVIVYQSSGGSRTLSVQTDYSPMFAAARIGS